MSEPVVDKSARDADFYDEGWRDQWVDMKTYSPMARHTRRWIHKLLNQVDQPESIGDAGCGEGSLLLDLARKQPTARIFGCDFSPASVDTCKHKIPAGRFSVHDLREPGSPFGKAIDVVCISEVLEHIDEDEKALCNLADWSRYLIVTVPGGHLDKMAEQMGHLRHYDSDSLKRKAERCGFEVISINEWGFPFAYPFYARLRNKAGYGSVTGKYGPAKKVMTSGLYWLFFLNDFFSRGNKVFMLARSQRIA